MRNENIYIVLDYETGGIDPRDCPPIQLAGIAIDPRKLEPIPGGEFCSMMHPGDMSKVKDQALSVNKKTRAQIEAAPPARVVFDQFVDWCRGFNPRGRSPFTAPIAVGKNIRNFDWIILCRQCKEGGHLDKMGRPNFLHTRTMLDLEDELLGWLDGVDDLADLRMDTLREYFGLSTEQAHDALTDVRQTALFLTEFLKLKRQVREKISLRGSFAGLA